MRCHHICTNLHMSLIVAIPSDDQAEDYADTFMVAPNRAGGYTQRIVCIRKTGAPFS